MANNPNWHDAHALLLIDKALEQQHFTPELVAEISEAFRRAEEREPLAAASADDHS